MIGAKLPPSLGVTAQENRTLAEALDEFHGGSPLLEARYIRNGLGKSFTETISHALYENTRASATSPLLSAIARLCIPKRSGPGVRAVVDYNFDDLIERHLAGVGVQARPIYRDADIATR
jgi:hypothetical protein